MRLENKVAVITGAASGMGLAMAELFTQEGAKIVAGDWNGERLAEAVAKINHNGNKLIGMQGNIADQATAEALVNKAFEAFGRLDILVNNAGVMDYMHGVGDMPDDIYRKVMGINVDGPVFTTRRAIPRMIEQGGGSIVNIASIAGISGGAAGAAYTMSKHALVGLTRNTAWMYAKNGIRCNAICAGGTKTNIGETMPREKISMSGAMRTKPFSDLIPAFLDPIDIANFALFLASDESRFINGMVAPADGGWKSL